MLRTRRAGGRQGLPIRAKWRHALDAPAPSTAEPTSKPTGLRIGCADRPRVQWTNAVRRPIAAQRHTIIPASSALGVFSAAVAHLAACSSANIVLAFPLPSVVMAASASHAGPFLRTSGILSGGKDCIIRIAAVRRPGLGARVSFGNAAVPHDAYNGQKPTISRSA